jgi:hypothetical protein
LRLLSFLVDFHDCLDQAKAAGLAGTSQEAEQGINRRRNVFPSRFRADGKLGEGRRVIDGCCKVLKTYVVEWNSFFEHVSRDILLLFPVMRGSEQWRLAAQESGINRHNEKEAKTVAI